MTRYVTEEQWAQMLAQRALLDGWHVALADAISKALADQDGDADRAARQAADQVRMDVAAAVEAGAPVLDDDQLARIEQRARDERDKRPKKAKAAT